MTATERTPLVGAPDVQQLTGLRFYVVCFSLFFGVFLAALDGTVVTALLSHIASDLNELGRISWIASAYLAASTAVQPLYGKLSDIFGRKNLLLFCNITFGFGCLLCGVADDLWTLVLGRVISGIGGGGLTILSTIAISDIVPLRKRGVFQGIGNIAFGSGAGVGGIFGGFVSGAMGWRAAFWLQVPTIVISAALVHMFAPATKVTDELVPAQEADTIEGEIEHAHPEVHYIKKNSLSRVDFWGSLTLVSFLVFTMLAISNGGRVLPWTHWFVVGSFAVAAAFLAGFIYVELYVAREPVIPLQLFAHRTILASSLTNLFMSMTVYATLFFVPVYLSAVFGMTPQQVGYRLTFNFLGVATGSFGAGLYMRKTGRYYWLGVLTPALYVVGILMICALPDHPQTWWQFVSLYFTGSGYAAMLTVTLIALISAVPHTFQAVTTSIQYAFRGVGSTLGVALASSLFSNMLLKRLNENVHGPHAKKYIKMVLDSVDAIRDVPLKYQPDIIRSYQSSLQTVFLWCLGLAAVGVVTAACTGEHPLHSKLDRAAENNDEDDE